ncbi:MAG: hypothetical protein K2Z81_13700 [Cyanobacteria bacterium]|nr:hypothetical protein [Cyanobacteriota bacterium]
MWSKVRSWIPTVSALATIFLSLRQLFGSMKETIRVLSAVIALLLAVKKILEIFGKQNPSSVNGKKMDAKDHLSV